MSVESLKSSDVKDVDKFRGGECLVNVKVESPNGKLDYYYND